MVICLILQNKPLFVYVGLKHKFCENINRFGFVVVTIALGPQNDRKTHTAGHFVTTFLGCGILKTGNSIKSRFFYNHNIFSIIFYVLVDEKVKMLITMLQETGKT